MAWRVYQQQVQLGLTAEQMAERSAWHWFLPMWALAFGGVCIRTWRQRLSISPSTLRSAIASMPIYFGGLLVFLAIIVANDLKGLLW